ncbi:MAG: TIGR02996 domain-containing protein, partial [Proteobacteria bacterium]|nr:TIGR02996 domain-containing protein [Pseudomonadota bacterium]
MARLPAREVMEQALLAAIYAAPTDDAPRLVYADYLMERGDKRGVVIALQCGDRDRARAHRLLASHRRRWLGPLTAAIDLTAACTFERGFVATATLATAAPPELDEHPAWATLRHVQLPKAAKQRTGLLAHLARLGVTTTFPRALRRADTVLDDLTDVAGGKSENTWWRGPRGLANLGVGVDQKLVERVMRIILPWSAVGSCDALPDEYVPIAWRVLATVKTPEATFLNAYRGHDDGARLRDACSWLYDFRMVDGERRNRHRLPALMEDDEAVHAALATVARHGLAAQRLLAVPAHLGDDAAVAAVQPTIVRALATRGLELDDLEKWLVPYARGPAMMGFVAAIADA